MIKLPRVRPRSGGNRVDVRVVLAGIALAAPTMAADAAIDVKRGDPAPRIVLRDAENRVTDTAQFRDTALVIVFGESGHERTRAACTQVQSVLNEPDLLNEEIRWIIVLSKGSDVTRPQLDLDRDRLAPAVLHDLERVAFGDYGVVVLPSVVIVDREGRVVHAQSGLMPRTRDITYDALKVVVGTMSLAEFDKRLDMHGQEEEPADFVRARRLTNLANQLARRDMHSLAVTKYREALELWPDMVAAKLGLGRALAAQGKDDEATQEFQAALRLQPDSVDAVLGLAAVYARGGDARMAEAEAMVRRVLGDDPEQPRAHYVLGLIQERRGQLADAAGSFRTAAELLLDRDESDAQDDESLHP